MTTMSDGLDGFTCRALSHARIFFAGSAAPTILFIHGGFHGAWCWSKVLAFLAARGVSAAALDLRGHGGLTQGPDFASQGIDAMTADVKEALNLMPRRPILAGHSLGALLAMKAADQLAPRGVILLAPATSADVGRRHPLPRFPTDDAIQPPDEARTRKWFLSGDTRSDVAGYVAQLCPESPKLLNECFHQGIAIPTERISYPLFILSGGKDDSPLHPAGQDQAIAAHYRAPLHAIPASGHCMMLDDGWQDTAAAIETWARSLANT
jgi:pimeloyl-ACP methyl ester carboxylesterase